MEKKNVIVTGTSAGVGYHLANLLSENKAFNVIGLDKNSEAYDGAYNFSRYYCDVTDYVSVDSFVNSEYCPDQIDILINNAGTNYINWIQDTPEDEWKRVMDTNAKSIFLMTKYFYEKIKVSKGTICNIVSNAAYTPMRNSIAYNASKGAAYIMTQQMARELGDVGITVFGLCPKKIEGTEMSKYIEGKVTQLRGWTDEEAREYQLKGLPSGKEIKPETFAEFVAFLLSTKERHQYLHGNLIDY